MPYAIKKVGNDFEVVNKDTGKVMGHHPTMKKAVLQMRALYANVKDAGGSASKKPAPKAKPSGNIPPQFMKKGA